MTFNRREFKVNCKIGMVDYIVEYKILEFDVKSVMIKTSVSFI